MFLHRSINSLNRLHMSLQALSVNLRQQTLDRCMGNLSSLDNAITRLKQTDAQRLRVRMLSCTRSWLLCGVATVTWSS